MSKLEVSELSVLLSNLMSSGQWERALEVTNELLALQPESDWRCYQMGTILLQLKRYTEAEKFLKKAIAGNPVVADYYEMMAHVQLGLQRGGKAEDAALEALRLNPQDPDVLALVGHLAGHFEDAPRALECADRALALDPEHVFAGQVRVRALASMSKRKGGIGKEEQVTELKRLLELEPESASLHFSIGAVYYDEMRDWREAERWFYEALRLDPEEKDYEKYLIKCVRKRDWVLRLLWLPFWPSKVLLASAAKLGEVTSEDLSWKTVLMLPVILIGIGLLKYFVVIWVFCTLAFGLFFWPLTKVYEWLTLADVYRDLGLVKMRQGWRGKVARWPFAVRFGLFVVLALVFWLVLWGLFTGELSGQVMGAAFGVLVFFGVVGVLGGGLVLMVKDSSRGWRRKKRLKGADQEE